MQHPITIYFYGELFDYDKDRMPLKVVTCETMFEAGLLVERGFDSDYEKKIVDIILEVDPKRVGPMGFGPLGSEDVTKLCDRWFPIQVSPETGDPVKETS